MGKYKLLELRTNTSDAACLDPKTTTTDADDDEQPVTKRDFKELRASIVWATGIYAESRPATSRGDGTKTR